MILNINMYTFLDSLHGPLKIASLTPKGSMDPRLRTPDIEEHHKNMS